MVIWMVDIEKDLGKTQRGEMYYLTYAFVFGTVKMQDNNYV